MKWHESVAIMLGGRPAKRAGDTLTHSTQTGRWVPIATGRTGKPREGGGKIGESTAREREWSECIVPSHALGHSDAQRPNFDFRCSWGNVVTPHP